MRRRDDGAAVPDFVFVTLLVLALFLVVLQVGMALHARNVLVSVAAEGARYAANADVDAGDREVVDRTRAGVRQAFSAEYAGRAAIVSGMRGGLVEVRITAPLPLAFVPGAPIRLTVRAHAFEERR